MAQNGTKKKNDFIEAYKRMAGNISAACKATNIPRRTYYNWIKNDAFRNEVDTAYEETIDWVESKLMRQIEDGSITAIIFYLKTKGAKRGYIERYTLDQNINNTNPVFVVKDKATKDILENLDEL